MNGFENDRKKYSVQQAVTEASRCLSCHDAPCGKGCPACIDVEEFVRKIKYRDFLGAARLIKSENPLGIACALVCPTEEQCMGRCLGTGIDAPIDIGGLQRFAAEYGIIRGIEVNLPPGTGKKVAVIGAGPAGLTAGATLARLGHDVVIYEKEELPGGILTYGIPEFRLPIEEVRTEIEDIEKMGVSIRTGKALGRDFTISGLLEKGYHAIFLGVGSYEPLEPGLDGEDLKGVFQAKDLLRYGALLKTGEVVRDLAIGKNVLVFGGGNTALDAASTALRLGADHVTVVYRRGFNEMPAWDRDVRVARQEKVDFLNLTTPVRFIGSNGILSGVECVNMKLGQPDACGRRRPVPIEGSEHVMEADSAIIAIGQKPDASLHEQLEGVELDQAGLIKIDPESGATALPGVFAGGDIVNGGATVARAVAEGKIAAVGIHAYLGSPGMELVNGRVPMIRSPVDDVDLSVDFCGIRFPNPFVLSSAPPTTNGEMIMRAFEAGWGGAVTKTIGPEKIPVENVSPRLARLDHHDTTGVGLLNIELISQYKPVKWLAEIREIKDNYPKHIVIASIMAEVIKEDWQELTRAVVEAGADAVELNLSCPHGMPEKGMGSAMGQDPVIVRKITGWVKEVSTVPVLVKLTPNVTDIRLPARAALEAGADALTAINTVAGLMAVDIETFSPLPSVSGRGTYGGYSGTGVKPIGLRAVSEISQETGLPVSGLGGISTWMDALQYILVGSSTLQVCTSVMFDGYDIVEDIKHGLKSYMYEHGYASIHELVGKALPKVTSHEKLSRDVSRISSIDAELCVGCGRCYVVCRDSGYNAIALGEDRVPVVDGERCDGCSLCTHVCPVWGCVVMKELELK